MTNPGQTIGRYRIQKELGSGAMGTVYLAMDPLLMRLVAIKVVREVQGDQSEILARFQREALISGKLNHPHIITIFDVGEDPILGPFMAMEYIDGATLAKLIRDKLAPIIGLRLLVQVMSALRASERGGVSHRDVKPDNILVGKDWRVKLLDFGIARSDEARITHTGMIYGTPHYTAPEVLMGTEASSQSDRYSFAVTAFEVLSGALPFHGTSIGSVLCSIIQDPPTMPEFFTPPMKRVFERALAKEPSQRYPDLLLFMEALLGVMELPKEDKARLISYVARLRAHGLQAPMQTDPLPLDETNIEINTKALANARSSGKRTTLIPRDLSPSQALAPAKRGRTARTHKTILLRGGILLAIAAGGLMPFSKPARNTVGEWFALKHLVSINSSPGNAMMYLDGRPIGKTPAYEIPIRGSAHTLRIELAGYTTETRVIRAEEAKHFFSLKAEAFFIPVNSDPAGAQVFLNDQPMGNTPMAALKVPAEGRQELVMRLHGYREWRAVVDPELPLPDPIRLNPGVSDF